MILTVVVIADPVSYPYGRLYVDPGALAVTGWDLAVYL